MPTQLDEKPVDIQVSQVESSVQQPSLFRRVMDRLDGTERLRNTLVREVRDFSSRIDYYAILRYYLDRTDTGSTSDLLDNTYFHELVPLRSLEASIVDGSVSSLSRMELGFALYRVKDTKERFEAREGWLLPNRNGAHVSTRLFGDNQAERRAELTHRVERKIAVERTGGQNERRLADRFELGKLVVEQQPRSHTSFFFWSSVLDCLNYEKLSRMHPELERYAIDPRFCDAVERVLSENKLRNQQLLEREESPLSTEQVRRILSRFSRLQETQPDDENDSFVNNRERALALAFSEVLSDVDMTEWSNVRRRLLMSDLAQIYSLISTGGYELLYERYLGLLEKEGVPLPQTEEEREEAIAQIVFDHIERVHRKNREIDRASLRHPVEIGLELEHRERMQGTDMIEQVGAYTNTVDDSGNDEIVTQPSASFRTQIRDLLARAKSGALEGAWNFHINTRSSVELSLEHNEIMDVVLILASAGLFRRKNKDPEDFSISYAEVFPKVSTINNQRVYFPYFFLRFNSRDLISYINGSEDTNAIELRSLYNFEEGGFPEFLRTLTFVDNFFHAVQAFQMEQRNPELLDDTEREMAGLYRDFIGKWTDIIGEFNIQPLSADERYLIIPEDLPTTEIKKYIADHETAYTKRFIRTQLMAYAPDRSAQVSMLIKEFNRSMRRLIG